MRSEEDEKILEQLKILAKEPNMLDISHYEDNEISSWKIGDSTLTGDGGVINYYKLFNKEIKTNNDHLWEQIPKNYNKKGLYQQLKDGDIKPRKIWKFTREDIMKIFEDLFFKDMK